MQNLSGTGRTAFQNGAIVGINLAALMRNVASAYQGGAIGGERGPTSRAVRQLNVRNGVLTNDDLAAALVLRVAGLARSTCPHAPSTTASSPRPPRRWRARGLT